MNHACLCSAVAGAMASLAIAAPRVTLDYLGRYSTGVFDRSAAEIVAYEPASQRAFVTNAAANAIDVLDVSDPADPSLVLRIGIDAFGGKVNSVAVSDGLVAAAIESHDPQAAGTVAFFDTDGAVLNTVTVGAMPDMITFTPDGRYALTANEGEPDDGYTVDPEGSVSIIDVGGGVTEAVVATAGFRAFNDAVPAGVRVFGPGASAAQDLEPEYIAVGADSSTAYVICQENNALAIVDIADAAVTDLVALGSKDHSRPGNRLDASDRDGAIRLRSWPVRGLYQPDAIAAFESDGKTYLVTANEGDARTYEGLDEQARIADFPLDPSAFPDAEALQADENLGRLHATTTLGDPDNDGDYDELYCFGARSVSIWDAEGSLVWDSGDEFERVLADRFPDEFNAHSVRNGSFDARSDDKGPEPEAVAIATIGGATYAFVALERAGGIVIYDITDPALPRFAGYDTSRDFGGDTEAGTAGDLGPEGITVVDAGDSPDGTTLLLVGHEVSGTVAVYRVSAAP